MNVNLHFETYAPYQKFLWIMVNDDLNLLHKLGDILITSFKMKASMCI